MGSIVSKRKGPVVHTIKVAGKPLSSDELVPRPLTEEERNKAWVAANLYRATSHTDSPVALWVLGPSSVGKSTLTGRIGPRFGVPRLHEVEYPGEECEREELDAVVIDGEFMRNAHPVWEAWVKTTDWKAAYPRLKPTINHEKDLLCSQAIAKRKNLILPHTMLNLEKGLHEVEELAAQGYINHVVGVVAPLRECMIRGQQREQETGKRYCPDEYEKSIMAIPPMIKAANGRFEVFRAVEHRGGDRSLDLRLISAGQGGRPQRSSMASSDTLARCSQSAPIEIMAAINAAIGQTGDEIRGSRSLLDEDFAPKRSRDTPGTGFRNSETGSMSPTGSFRGSLQGTPSRLLATVSDAP